MGRIVLLLLIGVYGILSSPNTYRERGCEYFHQLILLKFMKITFQMLDRIVDKYDSNTKTLYKIINFKKVNQLYFIRATVIDILPFGKLFPHFVK